MTSISGVGTSTTMIQQLMSTLQNADTDADSAISFEEFSAAISTDGDGNTIEASDGAASLEQMFSDIDTDGDGYLSETEISSFEMPSSESSLESATGNLLSEDTLSSLLSSLSDDDVTSFFESADADGDGTLTVDELQAAIDSLAEEVADTTADTEEEAVASSESSAPPPPPGGASSTEEEDEEYDVRDTNQDGVVSAEELAAAQGEQELSTQMSESFQASLFGNAMISAQEQMMSMV